MDSLEMRDALRSYVREGEPPMSLTAAGLIAQGRRRWILRTSLAVGSGSGAAAFVTVLALILAGVGRPSPTYGPADSEPLCAAWLIAERPSATVMVTSAVLPREPWSQRLADRLACYLTDALRGLLPHGTFQDLGGGPRLLPYSATLEPRSYNCTAFLTTSAASGRLDLQVTAQTTPTPTAADASAADQTLQIGPGGITIVYANSPLPIDADGGIKTYVAVYTGQSLVQLTLTNVARDLGATRNTLPLTTDQLVALAAHPEAALYDH